jgi:hypothetical protein
MSRRIGSEICRLAESSIAERLEYAIHGATLIEEVDLPVRECSPDQSGQAIDDAINAVFRAG